MDKTKVVAFQILRGVCFVAFSDERPSSAFKMSKTFLKPLHGQNKIQHDPGMTKTSQFQFSWNLSSSIVRAVFKTDGII